MLQAIYVIEDKGFVLFMCWNEFLIASKYVNRLKLGSPPSSHSLSSVTYLLNRLNCLLYSHSLEFAHYLSTVFYRCVPLSCQIYKFVVR